MSFLSNLVKQVSPVVARVAPFIPGGQIIGAAAAAKSTYDIQERQRALTVEANRRANMFDFGNPTTSTIARNLAAKHQNSKFVVDVKSTGLYSKDKVLLNNRCKTIYWKTGHSHIKRKVNLEKALAGFEKSGHFFFNQPLGYGYDDGINSAIQVCHLLSNQNKKMSEIKNELPKTYQTPTMAPFCKDEEKYKVVDDMVKKVQQLKTEKIKITRTTKKTVLNIKSTKTKHVKEFCEILRLERSKGVQIV